MIVVQPHATLLRTALLCLGAGAVWAVVAAAVIYGGSRLLRVPAGRVWAEAGHHRLLWAVALAGSVAAAAATCDGICRRVGLRDLYWILHAPELFRTCRIGAACGYLLVSFVFIAVPLAARALRRPQA